MKKTLLLFISLVWLCVEARRLLFAKIIKICFGLVPAASVEIFIELIFKSYSDENNLDELSEEAKTQLEKDMYILNWMFKSNKNSNINYDHWTNRINNLSALYEAGDKLYTLSVYDIVFNIVKKIYESKKDNEKLLRNYKIRRRIVQI